MNDDAMQRLRATVKPWAAGTYMPESIMDIRAVIEHVEALEAERKQFMQDCLNSAHNQRIVELEAALREIADHIDIGQVGSARKTDIARRALEEK